MNSEYKKTKFNSYFIVAALVLLVALVFSVLLMSLVPPVSRDALTHHLAVPKLWVRDGGISEYPHISFSYYPMNLDILYAVSLYLGNDIAPKFIHFAFGLLTAASIFFYLRKRLSPTYGLLGALFFLSLPVVVKLSINVYVDLGLIFFTTVSMLYFLKWMEYDFQIKHIIISSIFCGLALGTKYNGLVFFFLMSCFVPLFYIKNHKISSSKKSFKTQLHSAKYGLFFMLISIVVFSPWAVKNTIHTGNPLYPLYKQTVNKGNSTQSIDIDSNQDLKLQNHNDRKLNHFLIRKLVFKENWYETALIPLRIFFQGKDDDPQYFDGKLNPFLILLPFLTFIPFKMKQNPRTKTELSFFAVFSFLYLIFVFLTRDMRIRYILPIIPPLVILSIFGLQRIHVSLKDHMFKSNEAATYALAFILFCVIFINALYLTDLFSRVDPLPYIKGIESRDEYIQKRRPEYAAYQYINSNLAENAIILGLFIGKRRYYCDRDIRFDFKRFKNFILHSRCSDGIVSKLKHDRITHLLINRAIFKKWTQSHFNDYQNKIIDDVLNCKLKLIFSKSGYDLYETATG